MSRGIPTEYHGTTFRSRTEARWACFMDALGWNWEYEPFDLAGYIPDFVVMGTGEPALIEIKAHVSRGELEAEAPKILAATEAAKWAGHVLIFGATPWCVRDADREELGPGMYLGGPSGWLNPLGWIECRGNHPGRCGEVAVYNSLDSFQAIPCGHYDGDGHLGYPPLGYMREMWSQARNKTQWKPAEPEPYRPMRLTKLTKAQPPPPNPAELAAAMAALTPEQKKALGIA